VATLKGPAVFYMHTVNAYEVSTGDDTLPNILLDVVTYPDNSLLDALYVDTILNEPNTTAKACWGARLQRFTLSLSTPTAPVAAPATLSPVPMEFPTINYEAYNTRPYRYMYVSFSFPPWRRYPIPVCLFVLIDLLSLACSLLPAAAAAAAPTAMPWACPALRRSSWTT